MNSARAVPLAIGVLLVLLMMVIIVGTVVLIRSAAAPPNFMPDSVFVDEAHGIVCFAWDGDFACATEK